MANAIPITFINDATKPSLRIREIWADITYDNAEVISTAHKQVNLGPAQHKVIYSSERCVKRVKCYASFFDGEAFVSTFTCESDFYEKCFPGKGFDCRIRPPESESDWLISLGLSARTVRALNSHGVLTVQDLTKRTAEEIANLEGIGRSALVEFLQAASRDQLRLRT